MCDVCLSIKVVGSSWTNHIFVMKYFSRSRFYFFFPHLILKMCAWEFPVSFESFIMHFHFHKHQYLEKLVISGISLKRTIFFFICGVISSTHPPTLLFFHFDFFPPLRELARMLSNSVLKLLALACLVSCMTMNVNRPAISSLWLKATAFTPIPDPQIP